MNKSYCPLPFTEIYVNNAGQYRLCCQAGDTFSISEEVPPFEYFFSDEMEEIRDKLMQGEKLKDCNKCYELEKYGDSYRLKAIKRFGVYDNVRDVRLKLRTKASYLDVQTSLCCGN